MPRTAKTNSEAGRRYPLNMRTTAALRAKIDAAANASGRSRLQEIEARVERSFEQDELFGGPEGRRVVHEMGLAFLLAGQFSAGPDVPPKEWLRDTTTCTAAIASVLDTLVRTLPGFDDADALRRLGDTIAGRLAGRWASTGTAAGKATVRGAGAASYAGDRK
jgi:hypothetical protein